MREEFSLFSLGIGFDVDYDFLERIATENRGIAQRIYANHDAAEQLRVRNLVVVRRLRGDAALTFDPLRPPCRRSTARWPPPC